MRQVKTYIFDADGVVIEPWGFARVLRESYGITSEMVFAFFKGPFDLCMRGEMDVRDCLPPYLQKWGWERSMEQFISTWLASDDRPMREMLSLVGQIRNAGILCCLGSNQDRVRAEYVRKDMGFDAMFDRCFFSCEIGAAKPNKAFYEHITSQLKVRPEDIFFVDDCGANIDAAIEHGWHAVRFEGRETMEWIARQAGVENALELSDSPGCQAEGER